MFFEVLAIATLTTFLVSKILVEIDEYQIFDNDIDLHFKNI